MRRAALLALVCATALAGTAGADTLVQARFQTVRQSPRIPATTHNLGIYLGEQAARVEGEFQGTTVLRYDSEQATRLTQQQPWPGLADERPGQRGGVGPRSPLRLRPMGETRDIDGVTCTRYLAQGVIERSAAAPGGRSGTALPELEVEVEMWIGELPLVDRERLAHVLVYDTHFQNIFPFSTEQLAALPGVPIRTETRRQQLGRTTKLQLELLSAVQAPQDPARFEVPSPKD